jgi:hypothetical protein
MITGLYKKIIVKTLDSLKKNDIINLSIRKTAEDGFIPYVKEEGGS